MDRGMFCITEKELIKAEMKRLKDELIANNEGTMFEQGRISAFEDAIVFIDSLLDEQPEHSYFETIYKCGKKPHWKVGDTLAYYEFYSDREGECVLGKVTKVEINEELNDWFYTFEDGNVYDEESLLSDKTYKKN